MKLLQTLKEWLFYGHIWIALAAAGLGWLSLQIAYPYGTARSDVAAIIPLVLFLATLGVYTLHRLISYRKAKIIPETKRYRIVARHPQISLALGIACLVAAGLLCLPFSTGIWYTLAGAGFFTFFYLIPPLPGYRRLRDLPYVKVVWVAIAWTLITHDLPYRMIRYGDLGPAGGSPGGHGLGFELEYLIRFAFILAIALLFDLRDTELDRQLGVKTVANSQAGLLRKSVIALLVICGLLSIGGNRSDLVPDPLSLMPCTTYLLMTPVAVMTFRRKGEDWFAVVVNGLLLLPPLGYFLAKSILNQ